MQDTYKALQLDAAWERYARLDKAERLARHLHGAGSSDAKDALAALVKVSREIDALNGCAYTRPRMMDRYPGTPSRL